VDGRVDGAKAEANEAVARIVAATYFIMMVRGDAMLGSGGE
jgi:hypothetical protein